MKYGLLGQQLIHSYSPRIHHTLGTADYGLVEQNPKQVDTFLDTTDMIGLNVTIPYKEVALAHCNHISQIAERIGCINTMVKRDGTWFGDNTDYNGVIYALRYANISVDRKQCLILGDGATSKTVHVALEDLGASDIIHISRHNHPTYGDLQDYYESAAIIINATPVGMYPHCPKNLINLTLFKNLSGVMDLIYNPLRTNLLIQAERMGIPYVDGLPMLVAQAVHSSNLFHNTELNDDHIEPILQDLYKETENIILIGMPGVGKTTVGKELSRILCRPFVDCDAEITNEIGHIATFIDTHGEQAFRQVESAVIERLGKEKGYIISTGGGCVTIAENFAPLRQNGRMYQLTQPIESLDTKGRPLSRGGLDRLRELERVRTPMYKSFAQCIIKHRRDEVESSSNILNDFYGNIEKRN